MLKQNLYVSCHALNVEYMYIVRGRSGFMGSVGESMEEWKRGGVVLSHFWLWCKMGYLWLFQGAVII